MSLVENQKVEHYLLASVVSPFVKFHKRSGRNILKQAVNFSSYSNSGFQTTIYPLSSSTVIDKRMLLQSTVTVTTTAANSLLEWAPRSFPLASVMCSLQISINGDSTTSCPSLLEIWSISSKDLTPIVFSVQSIGQCHYPNQTLVQATRNVPKFKPPLSRRLLYQLRIDKLRQLLEKLL